MASVFSICLALRSHLVSPRVRSNSFPSRLYIQLTVFKMQITQLMTPQNEWSIAFCISYKIEKIQVRHGLLLNIKACFCNILMVKLMLRFEVILQFNVLSCVFL